jgi:hypothetical protein
MNAKEIHQAEILIELLHPLKNIQIKKVLAPISSIFKRQESWSLIAHIKREQ